MRKPDFCLCENKDADQLRGGPNGLVVRASDSGSGDPGSILGRAVCCFLEQDIYSPKVLVIPRNRWLRLNMTEKWFTGTLNHNQNKTKDQLRGDLEADQRLCFRYTDSTIPLLSESKISSL